MKKLLIVLGILIVVGGIVYGGYWWSTRNNSGTASEGGLPPIIGQLPQGTPAGEGAPDSGVPENLQPLGVSGAVAGLSLVSEEKFLGFAVAPDMSILAIQPSGKISSVSPAGALSALSDSELDNLLDVAFSSDAQKLVVSMGTQENKRFSVFDAATKTWKPLISGIISVAWKQGSHVLAYTLDKNGLKTVYSLDLDDEKAKPQQITSVHIEDLNLSWPSPEKLVLSEKASGVIKSSVLVFDLKQKTLSAPVMERQGAVVGWDSSLTRGVAFYASQNGRGGNLNVISLSGENINRFDFITFPGKCLFTIDGSAPVPPPAPVSTSTKKGAVVPPPPPPPDEKLLLCAIPRDQELLSRSFLPDDYIKRAVFTSDNVYKINLETGLATTIFDELNRDMDVQSP
ncbi:MAG: hypothetical protein Q7S36_01955, partial [Candidatus Liptonbacteria bacterium]|nr:hypothetical protein [Candidatus Liptonbacteria bacterium]